MTKIIFSADHQIKTPDENLKKASEQMLLSIENAIKQENADIYIIGGDMWENGNRGTISDTERELIYAHLARVISMPLIKEVVVILGNHDFLVSNKRIEENNSLNVFKTILDNLKFMGIDGDKLRYFQKTGTYKSIADDNLQYLVYSHEEKMYDFQFSYDTSKQTICLFHDPIKEFVDEFKLPLRPDVMSRLKSVNTFPENTLILAGDIHKILRYEGNKGQVFYYPGAPMQHTFGEGDYININKKIELEMIPVPEVIVVETDTKPLNVSRRMIETHICYTTITLDPEIPFDVIKLNLNKIEPYSGDIYRKFRVKSHNPFMKNEMEIRNILKEKYPNCDIEFTYEKFVQSNTFTENTTIQSIIDEKAKELRETTDIENTNDLIINSENIDNLILSDKQLIDLFKSVLTPLLDKIDNQFNKDITYEDTEKQLLELFEYQLSKTLDKSHSRFDIKFDYIETNGFMQLGPNRIQLDIPGITRILASNGVGKTTLYNMIRWVLTGFVYENMSKSTTTQNNLICFNNKRPDINDLVVKITMFINNTHVTVERRLVRKWKTNISDEARIAEGWENYISTLERDLTLTVVNEDGEKIYKDDIAQKGINSWFGKTIESILIIDKDNLPLLMKSNPEYLNELILDFIGVSYLRLLDAKLEQVKYDLMSIAKPKRKKEDIFEAKIDAKIKRNNAQTAIEETSQKLDEKKQELVDKETQIENTNSLILECGNIPELKKSAQKDVDEMQELIDNFIPKDLKEKIDIDSLQQPVSIDDEKEKQISLISACEKEQEVIDLKINELDTEYKNKHKELEKVYQYELNIYNTKFGEVSEKKEKINSDIYNIFHEISEILDLKLKEKLSEKNNLQTEISTTTETINNLSKTIEKNVEQLKSGICPSCKRPLDKTDKEHQKQIATEIINDKKTLEELSTEVSLKTETFNELDKEIQTILTDINYGNRQDIRIFENNDFDKYLFSYNKYTDDLKELNIKLIRLSDIKNYTGIENVIRFNSFDNSTGFVQEKEWYPKSYDFIIDMFKLLQDKKVETNKHNQLTLDITEHKNKLDLINKNYRDALEKYQKTVNDAIKHNNLVEDENIKIREHNAKKSQYEKDLIKLKQIYEGHNRLTQYWNDINGELENFTLDKRQINKTVDELNETITTEKLFKQKYEKEIEDIEKEFDEYIKYNRNQIVWKLYNTLIKSNFKEVVFDYYRMYLNNTLNHLLSDVYFKLFWNKKLQLMMSSVKNGVMSVQTVKQASGMELVFLGLSLIYTVHILNVKHSISNIFIDELSGVLNDGTSLSYDSEDYQELFVKIISKFKDKSIFIIDHVIKNLYETTVYEVVPDIKNNQSKYNLK